MLFTRQNCVAIAMAAMKPAAENEASAEAHRVNHNSTLPRRASGGNGRRGP